MKKFQKRMIIIAVLMFAISMGSTQAMAQETLTQEEATALAGALNDSYPLVVQMYYEVNGDIYIDPTVNYTDKFDSSKKSIILNKAEESSFLLGLGHFVGLGARRLDNSAAFRNIYNRESANYPGEDAATAVSSASAYFAACVKEYVLHPSRLMEACPSSVNAIKTCLDYFLESTHDSTIRYLKVYMK